MTEEEEFLQAMTDSKGTTKPTPIPDKVSCGQESSKVPSQLPTQGVIQRKLFTMTVINIYPNGNMFIDRTNSKSWFSDQPITLKKKEKVAPKKAKQATIGESESY